MRALLPYCLTAFVRSRERERERVEQNERNRRCSEEHKRSLAHSLTPFLFFFFFFFFVRQLLLVPSVPGAAEAAAGLRIFWGRALLLNALLVGGWRLPRLLLRQKRVRVGAFEPGQLKI